MPSPRAYSRYTQDATTLLGALIKTQRKNRRWTAADLAERVGVSLVTLRRIENGDPRCSLGLVFEAAALVGVTLFHPEPATLSIHRAMSEATLTLLPQRIRKSPNDVDDNF